MILLDTNIISAMMKTLPIAGETGTLLIVCNQQH